MITIGSDFTQTMIVINYSTITTLVRSCSNNLDEWSHFQDYLFRKLTDEIHKYETKLEKLESDLGEQGMRRSSLEETLAAAQDVHDRNTQVVKRLQNSGYLMS